MNDFNRDQMIDDYICGRLSKDDLTAFENQLREDSGLAEEVAINKNLFALHDSSSWEEITTLNKDGKLYENYLLSKDGQHIKKAINQAQHSYKQQTTSPIKLYKWYAAAASVVLLIAFSYIFTSNQNSPENLYADFSNLSELPSLTQRSDADKLLSDAEELFLNKQYIAAVRSLELYNEKYNTSTSNTLLYKGICYLELNDFSKATTQFNTLKNSNSLDRNKAFWYLALTSLKQKNIKETKRLLQLIVNESYFNHQKAEELLSILS
ncbi:MAG: hypothetical protein ACPG45_07625 [Flavobacteriaceae bacterium]